MLEKFGVCYSSFFFLFLSFLNKIKTELIKQLTRNETEGDSFTLAKLVTVTVTEYSQLLWHR